MARAPCVRKPGAGRQVWREEIWAMRLEPDTLVMNAMVLGGGREAGSGCSTGGTGVQQLGGGWGSFGAEVTAQCGEERRG